MKDIDWSFWKFEKQKDTFRVSFTITFERAPLDPIVKVTLAQANPQTVDTLMIRKLLRDGLQKLLTQYIHQRMMAFSKVSKNKDMYSSSAKRINFIIAEKSFDKFFQLIIKNQSDLKSFLPPKTSSTHGYWNPIITKIIDAAKIYSVNKNHNLTI